MCSDVLYSLARHETIQTNLTMSVRRESYGSVFGGVGASVFSGQSVHVQASSLKVTRAQRVSEVHLSDRSSVS